MASWTDYLETKMLGHTLLQSVFSSIGTVYAALSNSMGSDASTIYEVPSGTAYARQRIRFGAPSGRSVSNTPTVTFTPATTPWGGIAHITLHDSIAGGNTLYHMDMTAIQSVGTGSPFQIPAGNLTVTLARNLTQYLAQKILGHTLLGSTYTPPTTVSAGLYTSLTSDGDLTVEVTSSGTGYSRKAIGFGVPAANVVKNSNQVDFPIVTTPVGTIGWVGIVDTIASGNLLYWVAAPQAKYLDTNDGYQIPTSLLSISLD